MQKLSLPPAPEAVGDIPDSPPEQILYEKDLKPISCRVHPEAVLFTIPFPLLTLADPTIERVRTAKLTVKGKWQNLFTTTIKPGCKFSRTVETSYGVTSSNSQTTEFGTDIGAKGDIASINAKLKKVVQSTYTLSENTKVTSTIEKLLDKMTTICWWQEVLTFETSGTITEYACIKILGSKKKKRVKLGSRPYTHEVVANQQNYFTTSYPEESG